MEDGEEQEAELALVASLQAGDASAFEALLDTHLPAIQRYASRMIGNPTDAEDVAQEVFVRLWQKSHQFKPGKARLTTWLHQIAHNLCIDHFRRGINHAGAEGEAFDPPDRASAPDSQLSASQSGTRVRQAIATLPERQRSALVLCHYQGLSNQQAAKILEISVDALESLLSRARRKLKQLLEETPSCT